MRFYTTLVLLVILVTACAPTVSSTIPSQTATHPAFTPIPTLTLTPQPTSTPTLPVVYSEPDQIVLDFFATACEATWSNNSYEIPCPGNPLDTARGFIFPTDYASIEGHRMVEDPMLIGSPGLGDGNGLGLFGRYPAITIQGGDTFVTTVACQGDYICDVEFALEYFDANGNFHPENNWKFPYARGNGPLEVQFDLSALAGQTVEFSLVLRAQGPPQDARVVWINPHITRTPSAYTE